MAMQEYLKKYGVYRPNIFVMDSPILSLKEDVDASEQASDSMKASLFKYFTKTSHTQNGISTLKIQYFN